MVARKSVLGPTPEHLELDALLEKARTVKITDKQLEEQRVSFAYGNALDSENITKESIRSATQSIRISHD